MTTLSLQNKYQSKLRTAEEAVRMIRSGQRVFKGVILKKKPNTLARTSWLEENQKR